MRERLFVGVLTSKGTINTMAVAVNHTISHHLDNVVFFTGEHQRKVPHGMAVVTHGDERPVWNMYQTARHVAEHFLDQYDWFYLVQDDAYTQADRVAALVEHLSVERQLYMGVPQEFISISGEVAEGRYCVGGFGYLLSHSLLLRLQPFLEDCCSDILSSRPDEWLWRCIVDYAGTNCVGEHEVHMLYFNACSFPWGVLGMQESGLNTSTSQKLDYQVVYLYIYCECSQRDHLRLGVYVCYH